LPQQLGARPTQFAGFDNTPVQLFAMWRVFINQFTQYNLDHMAGALAMTLGAAALLAVLLRTARLRWRDPAYIVPFASAFGCLIGLLVLFWATDKTLLNFSVPRYGVFAVPGLALILAQLVPPRHQANPRVVLAATAAVIALGVGPRLQSDTFDNPWASKTAAQNGQDILRTATDRDLIVITGKEPGRIGTTLHMLPEGKPTVYTPTGADLAQVLAAHNPERLFMRPLFWAHAEEERPFPDGYYEAAQAAGYATTGLVWEKRGQGN
jgi:hypothetical protein